MAINKSPLKAAGGPDFGTVNIKAQPVKSVQPTNVPTSTADWSGMSDSIASIGESVAGAISVSKSNLEEVDKQLEAGKKPSPKKSRLERRVDKAKASGKDDKAIKLQSKLDARNTEKAQKKEEDDAQMIDKVSKAKTKAEDLTKAAKAKASAESSNFNEEALENRKSVTKGYMDNFLNSGKQYDDNAFAPLAMKVSPVLQKLGSTGKGFKLRAFKNN